MSRSGKSVVIWKSWRAAFPALIPTLPSSTHAMISSPLAIPYSLNGIDSNTPATTKTTILSIVPINMNHMTGKAGWRSRD
jgi:hypothetical protein